MMTAANRMAALNTSWPIPSTAAAIVSAPPATRMAPAIPAAIPPPTQKSRRATPRLAAMTMPTISAASSTSRKTMIAVASIGRLFGYEDAARGAVEIVEELVAAGGERPDKNADRRARPDHFLAMQRAALEFGRLGLLVLDRQLDLDPRRDRHLGGLELVVAQQNDDRIGRRREGQSEEDHGGEEKAHDLPARLQLIIVRKIALLALPASGFRAGQV